MIDSPEALVDTVLRSTLLSNDVYDAASVDISYPPPGFERDAAETVDARRTYLRFVLDHAADLSEAMTLLADHQSRELLLSLILFRILSYRRARVLVNSARLDHARSR